jgi:hypothetical protein
MFFFVNFDKVIDAINFIYIYIYIYMAAMNNVVTSRRICISYLRFTTKSAYNLLVGTESRLKSGQYVSP